MLLNEILIGLKNYINQYTQKGLIQIHFMDLDQPFFMILLKALNLLMIKIMKFGLFLIKKRKVEWMKIVYNHKCKGLHYGWSKLPYYEIYRGYVYE
ncbi:hypothetical protein CA600_21905 [Paenibacillus sp. VTT E-133280]|nr:hypothetical protein CA600_21905 [Paenibacillus sp. VTT E-133280]